MNTHHGYGTDTPSHNYNVLFSTCNYNDRHENPVRDNNISQTFFLKKDEHEYKDHYGVSNFKFPETTPKVLRKNRTNFCELSFDGTKSTKHHHRRSNTIKRVTSVIAINNCNEKKEEEQEVEKKSNKDTMTFHHLAEQFKNKLKFIDTPIKVHKNMLPNNNQTGSTFKVILSPKTQTSFTSIETVSNILQSTDNKIIVTQLNKPHMRDREIQTAIIGIRGVDEYFNMRLASVNNVLYNMDLSSNDDLFKVKRNRRKKLNLTMTNLPCVEIKCSSILFEMPANAVRPQMPRRTLNTNNSIIKDFHEASTVSVEEKPSEPVTVNSSERTDNLKDKLLHLFNDTQVTTSDDYNKKVNDLCGLISNLLTENKNIHEKNARKSVKMPGEMLLNITKLKAGASNIHTNDNDTNQQNILIIPSYSTHKKKLYERSSYTTPNRSNHSIPPNRSRSVTPPSRPSTPSCQISKISAAESNNQIHETNQTGTRSESKLCSNTTPNLTAGIVDHKFSFTSNQSISTISNGMGCDDSEDKMKQTPQVGTPVPRNVFLIPPHVNEILKNCDLQKPALANNLNNSNASDFHLINILKKPSIKQSWLTPDFVSTSHMKCDTVKHVQYSKITKQKKNERDCGGPSVTFNTMVDVFGDNESLDEQKCSMPPSKNTITGLKNLNTYTNKPEVYAVNDGEETSYENCGFFSARQSETNKAKPHYEKQASFYNSSFLLTKKDTDTGSNVISCLQKRKEYDHKWKMQLQRQNKQASKIPRIEQETSFIKNEPSKMAKSKLPLKVTNNKVFTTDIKDTPFIQKNSRNHVENNENVTKDVNCCQEKEILFIKYPDPNFHKAPFKFKVDIEKVDNKLRKIRTNNTNNNNYTLEVLPSQVENVIKEQLNKQPKRVIFVYPFSSVFKKDSVTKRKKMAKQRDHKNARSYSSIWKEKFNIFKNVKFKNSVTNMKPKINKVRFMEPDKWASLCKIKQPKSASNEKKSKDLKKCVPKESKKDCKRSSLKNKLPRKKDCKKCPSSQTNYSQIIKSYCENLWSGYGICNKQKGRRRSSKKSVSFKTGSCKCNKRKNFSNQQNRTKIQFKQIVDNILTCWNTLCCSVEKNTINNSMESIPHRASKCSADTCWLQVKPKRQKVYRVNSFKCCNSCLISTSKGILAKRKKPNPAWKFKELISNKIYFPCSLSEAPNNLYNIVKQIKLKGFINFHLNNEKPNLPNDHTKVSTISVNSEDDSTIRIGDTVEKYPYSLKNFKVVNKGRFTKTDSPRKINVPTATVSKKVVDTIFIPTSPRKYNKVKKEEFLLFRNKNEDVSPKTAEEIRQNIPTFPFPWIKNIPTSPKTIEDLAASTKRNEEICTKVISLKQPNDIKETSANNDDILKKNKEIEDRPIIAVCNNTEKVNRPTPVSLFPRKKLRDIHPVIFDPATRKIYENKFIPPRIKINKDTDSISKQNNTSNEVEDNLDNGKYTLKTITERKNVVKITKLPILKTRRNHDVIKTKSEENKSSLKRRFSITRRKQISKFVIETNEIVHIPDDDFVSLKSKDSKSSDYKSVITYSGFSSNSQSSVSSNSKRSSTTSRTLFNIVGNFFRRYAKNIKRKKSKSTNENG